MIFTHCELGDARSGKTCRSSVNAILEGIAVLCYINFQLMDITTLKCLNDVSTLFNSYIHDSNKNYCLNVHYISIAFALYKNSPLLKLLLFMVCKKWYAVFLSVLRAVVQDSARYYMQLLEVHLCCIYNTSPRMGELWWCVMDQLLWICTVDFIKRSKKIYHKCEFFQRDRPDNAHSL